MDEPIGAWSGASLIDSADAVRLINSYAPRDAAATTGSRVSKKDLFFQLAQIPEEVRALFQTRRRGPFSLSSAPIVGEREVVELGVQAAGDQSGARPGPGATPGRLEARGRGQPRRERRGEGCRASWPNEPSDWPMRTAGPSTTASQ